MIDFIGLELIEFHDVPVESICIENSPSFRLVVEFSFWDEDLDDYSNKTIIFDQLESITPDTLFVENNPDLEINSFDYHLKGEVFYGKMIYLTGTGKPSIDVEFSCRSVKILD